MDVSLSDLLTCPRCGPTYGLVLVPREVRERRVRSGVLGCANCRERYPIEEGVADLRVVPEGADGGLKEPAESSSGSGSVDRGGWGGWGGSDPGVSPSVRLAGLLGLAEARGTVLVAGPASASAAALSELVEGVAVVVLAGDEAGSGWDPGEGMEVGGVSCVRATGVVPLRSGWLRGVALTGGWAAVLEEGARVLGGPGHLVVDPAPLDARTRLEALGLDVMVEEGGVVVAARRG